MALADGAAGNLAQAARGHGNLAWTADDLDEQPDAALDELQDSAMAASTEIERPRSMMLTGSRRSSFHCSGIVSGSEPTLALKDCVVASPSFLAGLNE